MMMRQFSSTHLLLSSTVLAFLLVACSRSPENHAISSGEFAVRDFNPMVNWKTDVDGKESSAATGNRILHLDYMAPRETGFLIPAPGQTPDGLFHMEFYLKNTGTESKKFAYKIYYQNESYKFPEADPADTLKEHPYAWENFYGSWDDTGKTFIITEEIPADGEFHKVTDAFRIVGNPRNEQRYFENGQNDRWKRNPRTGEYSFLLVVTTPATIDSNAIPPWIRDISLMHDSAFVNPYFFFLDGEGARLTNTLINRYPYTLKVIAKPDPGAGIYINPWYYPADKYGRCFTANCGNDEAIYGKAAFEQFVHYIDPTTKYGNIPVIADVLHDGYSLRDYNWNQRFYRKEELVAITASTTKHPCETVISDPAEHKIIIKNPGTNFGEWEKQNVGVITRHGFTYGKWTVKAKLTELLNKQGLWNGLTNAIWLITQDQNPWNYRRDCNNSGYFAHYYGGDQDERVKQTGYSEIDFEILKTVRYCPNYILPPAYNQGLIDQYNVNHWDVSLPDEVDQMKDNILVACTNWDMACNDPVNYHGGCNPIVYNDQVFWQHKWGETYRAITSKMPESDDELFGSPYFYFQIDWEPERIIWRIGPEKDQLRVVGYVDNTITSIPNNQMLLIISQEFHNTRWWVGSMFDQSSIPFPKNDIIGEIYEVTIE